MEEQSYHVEQQQTSKKATTSLVLGILACVIPLVGFILGIIAVVFSKKASNEITNQQLDGHGLAVAGKVTGIVGIVLNALYFIFLIIVIVTAILAPAPTYPAYY
ncbi:DUF4190 domain-containing protein [Paraliobacillus ryukyuensis]|uniref:DUF4190 domain-containing protein n=1 Tax=Paraliobacillus ryukyuensis TaxID=200904 RepID=UPI0009A5BEC1|nr:DUF4190 domain-containing protein [Paraliobacillus ryukyuensis]